jgi:uncharacterized protein
MTPTQSQIVQKTADYIKEKFDTEATGHDFWHMYRVWKTAQHILKSEPTADPFVTELGALLHDVADWKFHEGSLEAGPKAAREWLETLDVDEAVIVHIGDIIRNVSFMGANVKNDLKTIEGQIIHDADKLDSIGAIGIARTFAYGATKGHSMYDPRVKPMLHDDFESYKKNSSHTINHFYEKLLLLKDRMFTETGKQMALERHNFMEKYLDQFYAEWDGKL